jgi:hypothetical protein
MGTTCFKAAQENSTRPPKPGARVALNVTGASFVIHDKNQARRPYTTQTGANRIEEELKVEVQG